MGSKKKKAGSHRSRLKHQKLLDNFQLNDSAVLALAAPPTTVHATVPSNSNSKQRPPVASTTVCSQPTPHMLPPPILHLHIMVIPTSTISLWKSGLTMMLWKMRRWILPFLWTTMLGPLPPSPLQWLGLLWWPVNSCCFPGCCPVNPFSSASCCGAYLPFWLLCVSNIQCSRCSDHPSSSASC